MKIIVIDDDPTGSQSVYGCPLLLTWDQETLLRGLKNSSNLNPQLRLKFNVKSNYGTSNNFWVVPSNQNAIITHLEPGNYWIEGYSSHPIATSNEGAQTHPLN